MKFKTWDDVVEGDQSSELQLDEEVSSVCGSASRRRCRRIYKMRRVLDGNRIGYYKEFLGYLCG